MTSQVEVVNIALGMIGEDPITSFSDDLDTARTASLRFATARDVVLREHIWNFAKRRQQLAKLTTAPAFGWDNQFQLPSDWLRMVAVNPDNEFERSIHQDQYRIEGRKLLTNLDTVRIVYIARIADMTQWDTMALEALSALLASELAVSITQNRELAAQLRQDYKEKLAGARSVDAMDEPAKQFEADEWTGSRLGAYHDPFFRPFGF